MGARFYALAAARTPQLTEARARSLNGRSSMRLLPLQQEER
jgi:hypothetical protein